MQLILSPCDSQRFNPFELFEHQPHVRRKSALAGKELLMPLAPKRQAFVAFALFGRHLGGHLVVAHQAQRQGSDHAGRFTAAIENDAVIADPRGLFPTIARIGTAGGGFIPAQHQSQQFVG
ncbi:Hypoticical protein [Serratia sp. FS14]|nr:Hypoticical protein [Serratia sp. FS14]